MPFYIIRQNIVKMETDAIVNAANEQLLMGGGVCGAIFTAAGAAELQAECNKIGHCDTGKAVITDGYSLAAKKIIHTPGPVYHGGAHGEAELLRSCYISSLRLAEENGLKSISFPLISSGIYGYPKKEAFDIAAETIREYLKNSDMEVYLILFNTKGLGFVSGDLKSYIDDNYVSESEMLFSRGRNSSTWNRSAEMRSMSASVLPVYENIKEEPKKKKFRSLKEMIDNKSETFSEMLLRLIDEKGMTDVETYKRANYDRKLFSKIRCSKDYKPSKTTALAFAVALELNLDETLDLLKTAGFTLSNSSILDLIVKYHIENEIYDIFTINEALYDYEQELLGAQKNVVCHATI